MRNRIASGKNEMINHIVSECIKLGEKENTTRQS